MGLSAFVDKIVADATGVSDHLFLFEKDEGQDWTLFFQADAWGNTDLQASADGVNWGDVQMLIGGSLATVNRTSNGSVRVPGGCYYRLDVNRFRAANLLLYLHDRQRSHLPG